MEGVERNRIHQHEDAAKWGLISGALTGAVALGSLLAFRRREPAKGAIIAVLVLDLWAVTVFARVLNLGGEIRHPQRGDTGEDRD